MQTQPQTTGWHVRNWGVWGWLETAVKAVGIIAGLIAFTQTTLSDPMQAAGVPQIAAIVILSLLTLVSGLVVILRITQREVTSLVYAVFNMLGHVGLWLFLVRTPDTTGFPLIFGAAYVVGELIKQRFLVISGYTEVGRNAAQMMMFSRGLMIAYLLFTVLVLL